MKKLCAILMAVLFTATFCSCRKVNGDGSNNSSDSAPLFSSEISSIEEQPEEPEVSQPEPSASSAPVEQPVTPTPQPTAPQEIPREPINFVPNRYKSTPYSEETEILLANRVFYNSTRYGFSFGKNNGTDCGGIITVDDNNEYLTCVSLIKPQDNESGVFTVYNNRIYFLKHPVNDSREYSLLNSFEIWSMDLQGGNKRQEKVLTTAFTHIRGINYISNSNYWYFQVVNAFNSTNRLYRYNTITNECTQLNCSNFEDEFYLKNNRIFVFDNIGKKIYEYDINYENKRLFFDTSTLPMGRMNVDDSSGGFVLKNMDIGKKYLLDMNGNVSELG